MTIRGVCDTHFASLMGYTKCYISCRHQTERVDSEPIGDTLWLTPSTTTAFTARVAVTHRLLQRLCAVYYNDYVPSTAVCDTASPASTYSGYAPPATTAMHRLLQRHSPPVLWLLTVCHHGYTPSMGIDCVSPPINYNGDYMSLLRDPA